MLVLRMWQALSSKAWHVESRQEAFHVRTIPAKPAASEVATSSVASPAATTCTWKPVKGTEHIVSCTAVPVQIQWSPIAVTFASHEAL